MLTPLWTLQTDCSLIGGVPDVVVVMVTCKGHLVGLGNGGSGSGWARVGGGTHSRKTEGSTHPRLGWPLQKTDSVCVCASVCMFVCLTS